MNNKRIIAVAASLSLLCGAVPFQANASDSDLGGIGTGEFMPVNLGDFGTNLKASGVLLNEPGTFSNVAGTDVMYVLNGDHYEVWGCGTDAVNVEILPDISGIPVTVIEERAFLDCVNLSSVVMPDTITEIKDYAFVSCENLAYVRFSNSLTVIGKNAFQNCISLTSIVLPDSLITIDHGAFFSCDNLQSVVLPKNLQILDGQVFSYCPIKSITIPASVIDTGIANFDKCEQLTTLTISEGVEAISTSCFSSCTSLESVVIPSTVKTIDSYSFSNCTNLGSITILNPYCEIEDDDATISSEYHIIDDEFIYNYTGTIYGYAGSTAQAYAEKYGYNFSAVGRGDVNRDGSINAIDASLVLTEYSSMSTGQSSVLTETQKILANVNGDSSVNAIDASLILGYYAYIATGGSGSLEEYLNK